MSDAKLFLDVLADRPDAEFFFQALNDKVKGSSPRSFHGTFAVHEKKLRELNAEGYGIFVQVNPNDGKGTDNANITGFRALFADLDDGLPPEGFGLQPSIIVESSPGKFQYYWCLESVATAETRKLYRGLLKGLVEHKRADPNCKDERRILRIPGFFHNKREPVLVRLSSTNGQRYTLDELGAAFPIEYEAPRAKGTDEKDWPKLDERVRRAKLYLKTTPPVADGGGHNGNLFWCASLLLRDFAIPEETAFEVYKEYDADSPTPANQANLEMIFSNAGKHAKGEMGSKFSKEPPPADADDLLKLTSENMVWGARINAFWKRHRMQVTWTGVMIDGAHRAFNDANNKFIEEYLDRKPGNILMAPLSSEHEKFLLQRNKEVVEQLMYDPKASPEPLKKFVAAITDLHRPEVEAVLGHFIWSVKRKLLGLQVTNHIMPVLVGGQGAGKSTAINKLLRPLGHHLYTANFDIFQDDRQKFLFHTYATIFLDEMAKARKADLDGLKHIITSETVSYRKLYTADSTVRPNITTFIGCSNTGVAELIRDTTGMRRFFEINTLPKLDWDVINSLEYGSIWTSVNEKNESPLIGQRAAVAVLSEKLRSSDFMDDWMEHRGIGPGLLPVGRYVLYEDFKGFLREQGLMQYMPSYQIYHRRMEAHGFRLTNKSYGCSTDELNNEKN